MSIDPLPRLERFRRFHSRDAETSRALLAAEGFHLDFPSRDRQTVDMRVNGIAFPGIYLGYLQYGCAAEIRSAQTRNDYRILPPIRGYLEAEIGNRTVACTPGHAIITSRTSSNRVRAGRQSAWLNIFVRGPALDRHLNGLLDGPLGPPLEFAPELSLSDGYGLGLAKYVLLAVADFERFGPNVWSPITINEFEELIISKLLLLHPHNYAEQLQRLEKTIAPRDVNRAIEYMEAHLRESVTLADVANAAQVPGRTLIKHFADYQGVSPMRYLRIARLKRVREALKFAEPEESITAIAMKWGFSHLGRFSCEYRKRFGETPSETRKKRVDTLLLEGSAT